MPWTTPVDRATGYTVTAADWSAGSQDDLTFLYGDAGWTAVVTFTNSWTNFAGPVGYILLGRVVYLHGVMNAGTAATAAFTLPVGYRPSVAMAFPVYNNSGVTVNIVTVNTTGTVVPTASVGTWLSGVTFPVV